jgi:hypothetical protein
VKRQYEWSHGAAGKERKEMTRFDFNARARMYLGRDRATALAQGAKSFRTAAEAIRFAIEEAAPVSLHGALLVVGNEGYSGARLKALYASAGYPLRRKADIAREYSF